MHCVIFYTGFIFARSVSFGQVTNFSGVTFEQVVTFAQIKFLQFKLCQYKTKLKTNYTKLILNFINILKIKQV